MAKPKPQNAAAMRFMPSRPVPGSRCSANPARAQLITGLRPDRCAPRRAARRGLPAGWLYVRQDWCRRRVAHAATRFRNRSRTIRPCGAPVPQRLIQKIDCQDFSDRRDAASCAPTAPIFTNIGRPVAKRDPQSRASRIGKTKTQKTAPAPARTRGSAPDERTASAQQVDGAPPPDAVPVPRPPVFLHSSLNRLPVSDTKTSSSEAE